LNAFGALDRSGLAVWLCAWLGYSLYAGRLGKPQANLMASVARFRRIWMREVDEKLIAGAVGLTAVLHYMEFRSATVRALGTG
jgi:uncharacterized membrane protein